MSCIYCKLYFKANSALQSSMPISAACCKLDMYSSFIKVRGDGFIVDTPGVRSLALNKIEPALLAWAFKEMRPYIEKCRYRSCQHNKEPDCAVRSAVDNSDISKERYISYLGLLNEQR